MDRTKLKVVSVVEALTNALMKDIFDLKYQPGQQVTETEMTMRYDVSRNTVREAVTRLEGCGLVHKETNRGVFIKRITEQDVREIFHFREMHECEAVRMIIANGKGIPEPLNAAMERVEQEIERSGDALEEDWYRFVSTDLAFHLELVRAAGSARLTRIYESIRHEIMLSLCQSRNTLIMRPKNIYEHRKFIEVLAAGDEAAAVDLVSNHIRYGVENVARGFQNKN